MSQLIPQQEDLVLLERDALIGGIRVNADKLLAFGAQIDTDLETLVRRWQPYAAPRALLADRRVSSWR